MDSLNLSCRQELEGYGRDHEWDRKVLFLFRRTRWGLDVGLVRLICSRNTRQTPRMNSSIVLFKRTCSRR